MMAPGPQECPYEPAGVRRAFGERAPRAYCPPRRTAANLDGRLAGTTAVLATKGTRRIAHDGSRRSRLLKIKVEKIKILALTS
jgi:hypothetical protein